MPFRCGLERPVDGCAPQGHEKRAAHEDANVPRKIARRNGGCAPDLSISLDMWRVVAACQQCTIHSADALDFAEANRGPEAVMKGWRKDAPLVESKTFELLSLNETLNHEETDGI
jgi:hypothetical protein